MFKNFAVKSAFAITAMALAAGSAQADMIYADVMGGTAWMTNIVESSPSGDDSPLFGQPVANGNNFDFAPTGDFAATSQDGTGTDLTDGKLTFMITAKPGYAINTLEILESGVATLLNVFDGDAFASVSGIVDIDINEIDGQVMPIELGSFDMTFSPNDGQYQHSIIGTGPQETISWEGGVEVDLYDAAVQHLNTDPEVGVTKVTVTLDNILLATTLGQGTTATIDKKDFDINITTDRVPDTQVPEPTSAVLLMISTAALTVAGRRNS